MPTDTKQSLITLRFEGPSFDGGDLPASALREIALFQEAFIQVAEEIWCGGNPVWAGLPEGFAETVEPRMRSLRDGEVELGWPLTLNGQAGQDETQATRAATGALILTALERGANGDLHPDLSLSATDKLSDFGATLMPQDSITAHWGTHPPVRVDRWGRNALRRAALAACEAAADAPPATVGDLVKLIDRTFGQVPDEVWAESPPLDLWNAEDKAETGP